MILTLLLAASVFPSSPAADAIGAHPTDVLQPASVNELATEVFGLVGPDGQITPAFAVEVSPLALAIGAKPIDLRDHWPTRLLSFTTVSLATREGDDGRREVAQGLKIVLHDGGDPRWDDGFAECAAHASGDAMMNACVQEANANARLAAGDGFALAFATTQKALARDPASLQMHRAYAWVSGSTGFGSALLPERGNFGQLVLTGRYFHDMLLASDDVMLGFRISALSEKARVSLDASWNPRWVEGSPEPEAGIIALSVEREVRPGVRAVATGGGRLGYQAQGADLFTSVGLRFGK